MGVKSYVACDLGAESGRVILGHFDGKCIKLEEIHRFKTGPTEKDGTLYWNVTQFFDEIKKGLALCGKNKKLQIESIGVDTWGVDFGLVDKDGNLLENPIHYRDKRTDGMMEKVFEKVPKKEVFELTGVQFMQINTLFQVYSIVLNRQELLKNIDRLLLMPALFNFFLTGEKVNEFSIATTTQFYDPRKDNWAEPLLQKLGIPVKIMGPIVKPGAVIGKLLPAVAKEVGLDQIPVVAIGTHDTASAVAAVPSVGDDWAFLSSGTWSLIGCEVKKPIINDRVLKYNLTNEGGVNNTIRVLKNVMGLWIVQECRRKWEDEGEKLSYQEITELAEKAEPFRYFVDVNNSMFLKPGDMPEKVQKWCQENKQKIPEDKGSIIRSVLESLAFEYREVTDKLEEVQNKKINVIHIVGGGTQNKLLCQFTANATKRKVVAGPVEATASGNILMQCISQGEIDSLAKAREIVRNSFEVVTYEPQQKDKWEKAYSQRVNRDF